ncbi:MAG: nucleoside triphosphate pyrophosphohydrolase [Devosiaceae bacterium]|nr:nucleoside triphosphate pyrophosphohydrolase [Devosiaceae bacterium MH13]
MSSTDSLEAGSAAPGRWDGPEGSIETLKAIMRALREPQTGCPWDVEQTFASIAPYTIEEAYEVADAIERNDLDDLCDELGDLLLQVIFHAQMASESGAFTFEDVVAGICRKMIRRHPHVFGNIDRDDAQAVKIRWEDIKAQERAEKAARKAARADGNREATARASALDGVPGTLPPVQRAFKLQAKAARVGFDWPDAHAVIAKLREETAEVEAELKAAPPDPRKVEDELGDVLFVTVNLARKAGIDPNVALASTNRKFVARFEAVEAQLAQTDTPVGTADLETMEAAWQDVKKTIA